MQKRTAADLDTLIADAERAVVANDAQFLSGTRELATAMRGRAGRVAATSALAGAALITGFVVYRIASGRREAQHLARVARGAPARPVPVRRPGAAGLLGEALGSAMRAATASPRPAGLLSVLTATLLPIVLRRGR